MSGEAQPASDGRQWLWWAGEGEQPEIYLVSESTRDAVIASARREYGDTATFTIVEATQDGPFAADIFDHDDMREVIGDRFTAVNGDRWGEDGWAGFHCTPEADAQLAAMLGEAFGKWLEQHDATIPTWTFTAQRNKATFGPDFGAEKLL